MSKLVRMHQKLRDTVGGQTDDPEHLLDVLIAAWEEMHREHAESEGAALIHDERLRQIHAEGWTPEHDDHHGDGEMAKAAAVYAWPNNYLPEFNATLVSVANLWPWDRSFYKPHLDDRVRELVKAGALVAAEIDRLQRALTEEDS
jgi:hypothetical protein